MVVVVSQGGDRCGAGGRRRVGSRCRHGGGLAVMVVAAKVVVVGVSS